MTEPTTDPTTGLTSATAFASSSSPPAPPPPSPSPAAARRRQLPRLGSSPEFFAFLFLVLLCVVLAIARPLFLTELNLQDIGRQSSVLLVLSVGLLAVLLCGGIDLSIGGMVAFSGVLAALAAGHLPVAAAFALAVLATTGVGVLNGVLIGLAGFSPIIVTLAVGQVLAGVALLLTVNGPIQPSNAQYSSLSSASLGPVPTIVIAAVACVLLAQVILSRSKLGRYIYSVGGNETAAWLAGIPTAQVKIAAYTICGLFAGAAGILASSRIGSGDASVGPAEMLEAFAAVFLGGVGFGTGRGRVVGVVCGALILGVIADGLDLIRLDSSWQYIVSGVVILVAIAFQTLAPRLSRRTA
jgi:ribose/xylose/arabinose/galactoside ABC-type transport system permease subunit